MRMKWVGGPLDGCVEEVAHPLTIWQGPDLTDPEDKVLIYVRVLSDEYRFDQDLTARTNRGERCW